ncbi:hypothetical protein AGABI2DRAFT_117462 [Agaricus bisporus var. bisporus H97]|uniref:hypothetical protein n=1 Tax=Agaricus bisporus var. bisporus (strain H97 / ATCC MYA-4626 / FGSC 10389) TaxID=936046 RepID=UPI00029F71A0|nr:hypothetical protein AGABI2DRAFT_117462 [Agaricus bisporus var. bisporus H97]EKV48657.1 hypothetical protein AGABI2DRAFT_117462 [Agaricus bisporus var. bisporus H97]
MEHPFLSLRPILPSSSRMPRSTADTMIKQVDNDQERPDSPTKKRSNEKRGSLIGTQAEEGWMLVLCDGTREWDEFLAGEQEIDSDGNTGGWDGSVSCEHSNGERETPVRTEVVEGRMVSRCNERNRCKGLCTSEQKNKDTDSDSDTEGWDGDVSGEDDDNESDTEEIQAKDSAEDEGGAVDDGYEADDETE